MFHALIVRYAKGRRKSRDSAMNPPRKEPILPFVCDGDGAVTRRISIQPNAVLYLNNP